MVTEPNSGLAVGVISVAGIFAASPFGLSMQTIFLATSFTMLGVFGRLGYEISKSAETKAGVSWGKVAALFGGSMISAACISVLYLACLALLKVQNESVLIFGLIFLGFSGPKGFIWLFNTASEQIQKLTGLRLPQFPINTPPPGVNEENSKP